VPSASLMLLAYCVGYLYIKARVWI
jgi:hypothetical protein